MELVAGCRGKSESSLALASVQFELPVRNPSGESE